MKSISLLIQQLSRMVDTIFENEINDMNISRGQYIYILYLYENEGANQYDISQSLLIDKTTVAKALKKLEANKLIMRKTDPRDKRRVKVYLTSKGKEAYENIKNVYDTIEKKLLSQLSEEKTDMFISFIEFYMNELNLTWSKIKNYSKKVYFGLADKKDIEQILKKFPVKLLENEKIFVKKYGEYVLNLIVFEEIDSEEISIIKNINIHKSESEKNDDFELIDEFYNWHNKHFSGEVYFEVDENNIKLQELVIRLGFIFKAHQLKENSVKYYYDRFKLSNV